ncbi:MAG: MFS transporter [Chloroflexota bacterium]
MVGPVEQTGQVQRRVGTLSIALFVATTFFFWASLYIYVPILPSHAQEMGASFGMVGLIVGAYGVTQFLLRIPLGVLSDHLGRRKPFIFSGMLAVGLGALGLALSGDPWLLFLARALTGVGASSWVAFTVLFSSYFPPGRAVRAMSLVTFVTGMAQVVSTYAGGQIAEALGPVMPFYFAVGLAGLGYVMAGRVKEEANPPADGLSMRRVVRIMAVPLLLTVSGIAAVNQYVMFVTTYTFTPLFAEQLGASQADLGLLVTATLLPYTFGMLTTSWLSERMDDRLVVGWGLGLSAVAVFATPMVPSLTLLIAVQAVSGFGRGLAFPVLMGLSIRAVPQHERATAMGVFQSLYSIGMFGGPMLGGAIADAFGLPSVFFSTSAISLLAALLAIVVIPTRKA